MPPSVQRLAGSPTLARVHPAASKYSPNIVPEKKEKYYAAHATKPKQKISSQLRRINFFFVHLRSLTLVALVATNHSRCLSPPRVCTRLVLLLHCLSPEYMRKSFANDRKIQ
jgi:hypothetical protein